MEFDRVVCDSTKRITGAYGWITLPDGTPYNHKGIDLGWRNDETQNLVYANCWGTVIKTQDGLEKGDKTGGGWGNYVLIKHPNGMCSRYAHLQKGLKVSVGTEVDESSVLGIMGESGDVTARHLHFEVQTNESADSRINPTPYLRTPIWSKSPEPTPVTRKFKVGDKVVLNGHLYADSYGNGKGQMKNDYVTTIGIVNSDVNATKPYNVGNQEGWVDERNLKLYTEPKPEPTPTPEIVKGTKVRVIGDGYGTSYGESPICRYRYSGYIGLEPMLDRPYPYCVYDDEGAVAWYKREDLQIL